MKVIVTEKPSVAMTFAKTLGVSGKKDGYIEGNGWIITWCVGHLVTLSYPEKYDESLKEWKKETLPFLPQKYKYEIIPNVAKQYKIVKSVYNRPDIDTIYYAGDPAREGIYIQSLVRDMAGHNPNAVEKVVWIDSQTEDEIKRGIKEAKPWAFYQNLANSGYERGIEDYAVGINFSRILSILYGYLANKVAKTDKYRPIAVGRVMTCVLGMIVSREREIANFVSTSFYKLHNGSAGIDAEWKCPENMKNSPLLYNESGFKDENEARKFMSSLPDNVTVEKVEKKIEKKSAPLLFNLAEFQSECTKKFKISPDQALSLAQSLYEKKLTTYPRTDARVLSTAITIEIDKNLQGLTKNLSGELKEIAGKILSSGTYKGISKSRYTDDSKVTDHYAIIPTGVGFESYNSLTAEEKSAYELIVKRFLAIFMPPAQFDVIKIIEKAGNERFYASFKSLKDPGFMSVSGTAAKEDENVSLDHLPKEGEVLKADYSIKKGETQPPNRYTSGSMILAMENAGNLIEDDELRAQIKGSGIGTSATRAETIKKLVNLEYINLNKKTQILTPDVLGNIVYDIVNDTIPELLNPKMTASWEKGLEGIATGQVAPEVYRQKLEDYIKKNIIRIKEQDTSNVTAKFNEFKAAEREDLKVKCPICNGTLKTSQYGCYCENMKNETNPCTFALGQAFGVTLSNKDMEDLITNKKTSKAVKGLKTKDGKKFEAILTLKTVYSEKKGHDIWVAGLQDNEKTDLKCPKCNNNLMRERYQYTCSCGFCLSHTVCGKVLSDKDINALLSGNKTSLLKGLKGKSGKSFDAYLVMGEDYKTTFEFPPKKKKG